MDDNRFCALEIVYVNDCPNAKPQAASCSHKAFMKYFYERQPYDPLIEPFCDCEQCASNVAVPDAPILVIDPGDYFNFILDLVIATGEIYEPGAKVLDAHMELPFARLGGESCRHIRRTLDEFKALLASEVSSSGKYYRALVAHVNDYAYYLESLSDMVDYIVSHSNVEIRLVVHEL
jgi:hypothetical protein